MAIVLRTPSSGYKRYYPYQRTRFTVVTPTGADASANSRMNEFPWNPSVEVRREENGYLFTADFRDVEPEDIKVSVTRDYLEISGATRREKQIDRSEFKWHEVSTGTFARRIALPAGCDWEKAEAVNEAGFLKVTVPSAPAEEPRQIPISSSTSAGSAGATSGESQGDGR